MMEELKKQLEIATDEVAQAVDNLKEKGKAFFDKFTEHQAQEQAEQQEKAND